MLRPPEASTIALSRTIQTPQGAERRTDKDVVYFKEISVRPLPKK
jgi:hypothetical protein